MRMRSYALAGALCVVGLLASAAWSDTIVLQQDLDGYTGVADTNTGWGGTFPGGLDEYMNSGARPLLDSFSSGDTGRLKTLVRFGDLDTAIPAPNASQITSATFYMYKAGGNSGTPNNVSAYRLLRAWDQGTWDGAGDQNWLRSAVDGANNRFATAPTFVDATAGNKVGGYNTIYETTVPGGATVAHASYGSDYNIAGFSAKADLASLDNTNGWLQVGDTLYVSLVHAGVRGTVGMGYWLTSQAWDGTDGPVGAADIDRDNPKTGNVWPNDPDLGWGSVDVTDWVQAWFADPGANHGLLLASNAGELELYSSDYNDDTSLRPYLEVEYVPEPAGLGLIVLGAIGLLRRRRRA